MIKPFDSLRKTAILFAVSLSVFLFYSQNAHASCVASVTPAVTQVSTDIADLSASTTAEITKTSKSIVKFVQTSTRRIVRAVSGLTTAISSSSEAQARTIIKGMGTAESIAVQNAKRLEVARSAVNAAVSASGCIKQTGSQHVPEVELVSKATAKTLSNELASAYGLTGSALNVSNEANTISYQSDLFRFVMANFCDPATNGGLMPTAANPIQTASGPLWCGMDRVTAQDQALLNLHLHMPGLLLNPSKIVDHPKARTGVIVTMLMLLGLPADKFNLPDLETAAGQREYMRKMAEGTRKMLPASYLSQKFAERFPSANNEASEWVRELLKYNKGEGAPQEVLDYIDEKYGGNVSQSQFLEAMVAYSTGAQHGLDTTAMSQGQYNRELLNLMGLLNFLKSKRLQETEVTNTLSAAIYAAGL